MNIAKISIYTKRQNASPKMAKNPREMFVTTVIGCCCHKLNKTELRHAQNARELFSKIPISCPFSLNAIPSLFHDHKEIFYYQLFIQFVAKLAELEFYSIFALEMSICNVIIMNTSFLNSH